MFLWLPWLSGTIWGHRTGSTLAQVRTCCLMAPSHYLNQYWRHLLSVRSSDNYLRAISQEKPQPPIIKITLKIIYLKFHSYPPETNEVTHENWLTLTRGLCHHCYLSMRILRLNSESKCKHFFQINALENAIFWMAAILVRLNRNLITRL